MSGPNTRNSSDELDLDTTATSAKPLRKKKNINNPLTHLREPQPPTKLTFSKIWISLTTFYLIPGEPILVWWNLFMVLVAVVNGISIPFMAAFRFLYTGTFIGQYCMDTIYLIDIYVKFHVSYLDRGFYVIFPKEMALHYMKSWEFSFDLFANLPFDLIALSWFNSGVPGEVQYFLSIVRLHKLIRTVKLVWWFHKEEKRLNSQAVFQMYKFTIYITLITHWCTCIWYVLACPDQCVTPSWATDPNQNPDFGDRVGMYVYSLYWTVMTMTTTGYGDVHATNDRERIWSIICMITGVFLYGYVSGTIASSLSNLDSRRVGYRQKVEAIQQYMQDQNMDKVMQKRVTGWYEYTWERNKGIDVLNVFSDLPSNFRAEVALSVNEDIIEKASIFRNTSLGFRRMLSIAMRINFFTADTYIVHRGEIGREMFFVVQGRVDILNHDESKPIGSMVEGSSFGEYMLVLGNDCEATAVAVCNCDVYVLSREDYDQTCLSYPEDAAQVLKASQLAYQKIQDKTNRTKKKSVDELSEFFAELSPQTDQLSSTKSPSIGGHRPSFGYYVMDPEDEKRIEQIKLEKRRRSSVLTAPVASTHKNRTKPIEDGIRYTGSLEKDGQLHTKNTTWDKENKLDTNPGELSLARSILEEHGSSILVTASTPNTPSVNASRSTTSVISAGFTSSSKQTDPSVPSLILFADPPVLSPHSVAEHNNSNRSRPSLIVPEGESDDSKG